VTLDNRRILVHRGDAQGGLLLGVKLGDAAHHAGLHLWLPKTLSALNRLMLARFRW
jgi:hypothetical protein